MAQTATAPVRRHSTGARITNLHVRKERKLTPPGVMDRRIKLNPQIEDQVMTHRETVARIISGEDKRMMLVVGPCSMSNEASDVRYAEKLADIAARVSDVMFIAMRCCPMKPRTVTGRDPDNWPGLLEDPAMDGSGDVNRGIELTRRIVKRIVELEMPFCLEVLDADYIEFLDDLVSLGWLGARDVQNGNLRRCASGLSFPMLFKNTTWGDTAPAIGGMRSAHNPSFFKGIDNETGGNAILDTTGNPDTAIILRGGDQGPNYDEASVRKVQKCLRDKNLTDFVMIDCGHGQLPSKEAYMQQLDILHDVVRQRLAGNLRLAAMFESNVKSGRQNIGSVGVANLVPGLSVTDGCVGIDDTEAAILDIAARLRHAS